MLTFLFVMVGPMHVLGPFAKLTAHFTEGDRRQLAWRTAVAATIALIAGAFLGSGALLVVVVLDLLTMLYATAILHWLGAPLQVFGSILSILQIALSIQLMFVGFRLLLGAAA